jgi:2-polyprenyl-3-methyl-5-hydroxy-6-metoxy-1,4-benzoquinol methylase
LVPARETSSGIVSKRRDDVDTVGKRFEAEPVKPTERYGSRIDLTADTVYARILNLVGEGKRVLDVGCATGNLARALTEVNHCTVTGIEIDPTAAEKARRWCEQVVVGDIESLDLETVLAGARVDVIIFADVLEHLVNPWGVLADAKKVLADGFVVASLPNVAHSAVVLELLRGRFQYRALGLLDDTHLRFFGKWDVVDLFEKAGYAIENFQRVYVAPEDTELGVNVDRYPAEFVRLLKTNDEATTYQFVVKARVAHGEVPTRVVGATSAEARGILGHIKLLNEDRAVWRAQAQAVGEDRDHWRQRAEAAEADRDGWRQRAATVEQDRDGWRQRAATVEQDRDGWRHAGSGPSGTTWRSGRSGEGRAGTLAPHGRIDGRPGEGEGSRPGAVVEASPRSGGAAGEHRAGPGLPPRSRAEGAGAPLLEHQEMTHGKVRDELPGIR